MKVGIIGGASSSSSTPSFLSPPSSPPKKDSKCFKGFCLEINIYILLIIFILCTITAASWIIVCLFVRKCSSMKKIITKFKRRGARSQTSELNNLNRFIDQMNSSGRNSNLNVDELIRENYELMRLASGANSSSPSSSTNKSDNRTIFDQFLSLDALPEPPSVSVEEIREINKAFNAIESAGSPEKAECKYFTGSSNISERVTSIESITESCSSNTTLDRRPVSACSTVNIKPKPKTTNFTCYKLPSKQPAVKLQITSMKSLIQQTPKLSPATNLKQVDQNLNDILERLRSETERKRTEVNNSHDWLKELNLEH